MISANEIKTLVKKKKIDPTIEIPRGYCLKCGKKIEDRRRIICDDCDFMEL